MGSNGIVTATNNKPVSPYIVVNIKKGITLAPSQIEKNLATEVLEAYHRTTNYPLTTSNTVIPYFNALEELGKTIRLASSTKRYFELKQKGERVTEAEAKRLEILGSSVCLMQWTGVIRDGTLIEKDIGRFLSIVFYLKRTNQLNPLPDKDFVDLCSPIEP